MNVHSDNQRCFLDTRCTTRHAPLLAGVRAIRYCKKEVHAKRSLPSQGT
jgi:hypothetical protein